MTEAPPLTLCTESSATLSCEIPFRTIEGSCFEQTEHLFFRRSCTVRACLGDRDPPQSGCPVFRAAFCGTASHCQTTRRSRSNRAQEANPCGGRSPEFGRSCRHCFGEQALDCLRAPLHGTVAASRSGLCSVSRALSCIAK